MTLICEQLVTKHTLELLGREMLVALEAVAQGTSEGVALHLPELGDLDACGVEFQGGTHRREELGFRLASHQDEQGFVLERVDGVDDIVIGVETEAVCGVGSEELVNGGDLGSRVDGVQTLTQDIGLHLADGLCGGHQLTVDVAGTDAVGINDGQLLDATSHQTLSTPRANATHAENDDTLLADAPHRLSAQQEFRPLKYVLFCYHTCLFGCIDTAFF